MTTFRVVLKNRSSSPLKTYYSTATVVDHGLATCATCNHWLYERPRYGDEYSGDRGVCVKNPRGVKKTGEEGFMCTDWNDDEKKRIEGKGW